MDEYRYTRYERVRMWLYDRVPVWLCYKVPYRLLVWFTPEGERIRSPKGD